MALTYYSSYLLRSLDRRVGRAVRGRHPSPSITTTDVETPQSVQLDFQTGVAPKTLVFGYVRWVDWTEFDVTPPLFGQTTAAVFGQSLPLVNTRATSGPTASASGASSPTNSRARSSIIYEPETGDTMPTQAPYDGQITGIAR